MVEGNTHFKTCKRCENNFVTKFKYSKFCPNCQKTRGGGVSDGIPFYIKKYLTGD